VRIREAQTHLLFRTLLQGFWLAVVMASSCLVPAVAQGVSENKRVLVVLSSDSFTATQNTIQRALRATLKESSVAIEIFSEYVGNTRAGADYEKEFVALVQRKYEGKKFDLIFTIGQFPTRVFLRNRPELFPGTPIVFVAVDQRLLADLYPAPGLTGVWGEIDLKPNLELALALHPGTRRVVMIQGTSDDDKSWAARAQADFRAYQSSLEFTQLTGLSTAEMQKALSGLKPNTIVFFVSNIRDNGGNTYESPDYLRQVSPGSAAPLYGTTEAHLGAGIVGGRLLSFEALGVEGGKVGLRVLAGEKPEAISPHVVPSIIMFDWREVQRWGISEQSLPPGSIIRFKQRSFWELYKWYVIGLVGAVVVEALLIAWLLVTQIRRRQAERERKQLAMGLADEHKRLNEVVSNVPGIVWEARVDPVTGARKATFVSEYVETLLGYSAEDFMLNWGYGFELIHEGDRERVAFEFEVAIANGGGSTQFRWLAKDQSIVWVEAHLTPILNDEGAITGIRGVTLDTTEKNTAEQARRKSEERNRAIFQAIPDQMLLQTRDGLFLDYRGDLLVTSEHLVGKNIRDVFPPDLAADFLQRFERAGKDDPQVFEYQVPFNGHSKWFEARIVQSGEDILTVVRDVTERRMADEALRQSEARFREMADTAPIMVWVSGVDKQRTYCNQNWLKFSGRSMEAELGAGWSESIYKDDYDRWFNEYESAFDRRQGFEMEYRLRRADGEYRWVLDHGAPRFSSDQEFLGFIGSSIDITERKQSEETLHRTLDELARLKNQLEVENLYLQETLRLEQTSGELVGQSDAIKYVLFTISQVAPTDSTVLIMGETGTGKELVASAIHEGSVRKDRPLIKVNCAALSASLIESELFGHEKGAFTGATARKLGRFELANSGTIFLDEIGELPLLLQAKLLRVIQEGEFERLGGTKTIKVNVRIIAATNRDLKAEVDKGNFRQDLWYRLNVLPITTPPLSQHKEDIPLLVEHFVARYSKKFGKEMNSVSANAMRSLQEHSWPGNVRELGNVIERAVIYSQGPVLQVMDRFEQVSEELPSGVKSLEEMERDHITHTLELTGWRIEGSHGAAKVLGLNPSTLRARMNKLQIQRPHQLDLAARMSH
jgi:formate hydrogenlyase transcriptional activator